MQSYTFEIVKELYSIMMIEPQVFFMDVSFLEDDEVFDDNFRDLSEYRQLKAEKLKLRQDKNLCVGAGILLGEGLKLYGINEKDVKYGVNENGRPYFSDYPEICFSLSHSGTKVMVCFSDNVIGCDIEKVTDINLRITERFFAKSEYEHIISKDSIEERYEAFFRYWTLKESYLKALGKGLSLSLNSFEIELLGKQAVLARSNMIGTYYFRELEVFQGYKSAVCSPAVLDKIKITTL